MGEFLQHEVPSIWVFWKIHVHTHRPHWTQVKPRGGYLYDWGGGGRGESSSGTFLTNFAGFITAELETIFIFCWFLITKCLNESALRMYYYLDKYQRGKEVIMLKFCFHHLIHLLGVTVICITLKWWTRTPHKIATLWNPPGPLYGAVWVDNEVCVWGGGVMCGAGAQGLCSYYKQRGSLL